MAFPLIPLAVLGGTGIFAWKTSEKVGESSAKILKGAAIVGGVYVIYKITKG